MILNNVYLPHTRAELADLVARGNLAPELLSRLDPERSYGIQWYSKNKWETDGEGHRIVTERPRDEWIAIPTPDAGVPREHVDAAREAIKDNVRPSDAGHRFWPLKGLAYCPCGTRLKPHTVNKPSGPLFYYICYTHRSDGHLKPYLVGPGTYRKRTPEEMANLRSEALDERARRYRTLYDWLTLHVVADPGGDLVISWFGGVRKVSGAAPSA